MWFLLGFLAGALLCGSCWALERVRRQEKEEQFARFRLQWAEVQVLYFGVLCRELANELIRRSPRRFVELVQHIDEDMRDIQRLSKEDIFVRLKSMERRYVDFDAIGTKSYILYEEAFAGVPNLVIEKHYRDNQVWCALNAAYDKDWEMYCSDDNVPTEKRIEEIWKYVPQYEDTVLLYQLKAAKRDYELHCRVLGEEDDCNYYKNQDFEVRGHHVKQLGDIEAWSVMVLATGDIGAWCEYYADDKTYVEFFALKSFRQSADEGRLLDDLNITEPRLSLYDVEPGSMKAVLARMFAMARLILALLMRTLPQRTICGACGSR